MSIFKAKQWWSNGKRCGMPEGIQNSNSIKVDKFSAYNDSDSILIGESSILYIYRPVIDQNVSATLLESELEDVILSIETGKFIVGTDDRQILILHPQTYAIYRLLRTEGHTDAGKIISTAERLFDLSDRTCVRETEFIIRKKTYFITYKKVGEQNALILFTKHSFTRRAHSVTCGPFGNIKTRDLICIQSLDGSLSFFDQGTFLFMCLFNDVIIPSPVCYVSYCDSFVICKSTWIMEIYSYQQLREFSELSLRQNKKNIPQWIYNAGEEISSIQVVQTSNNFSSIIALGERHLYCFQDNGLMKHVIKFDFIPMCFHSYLVGWYYEPGARLLVMVTSDDAKLFVYEGASLLWSCELLKPVISIARCFLKALPGGFVTLAVDGEVNVSYLGTEPDLNTTVPPMINESTDPEQVQAELEVVEASLQKIMENKEDTQHPAIEEILKTKTDVGKPVVNSINSLACPVIATITCEHPKLIQNISVTFFCSAPFSCTDSVICLDNIKGTEIIEVDVFLTTEADIPDTRVRVIFTVTDSIGKISVLHRNIVLPLSLYCAPKVPEVILDNQYAMNIQVNHPCIDFTEIFTDFPTDELVKCISSTGIIAFVYRDTNKYVTIKTSNQTYSVEANEVSQITSIVDHLLWKLAEHYIMIEKKDFRYKFKFNEESKKQLIHVFLKSIESHAKERLKLKASEDELNVLQKQFTLVQKKLLVQYGSLPPGDCDPLEFLMRDTHKRIIETVQNIIEYKRNVFCGGTTLMAIAHLITHILKQIETDDFTIKLVEETFLSTSIYEEHQEWEEAVTQGLTYLINKILKKSEKDKEKLAPVTEQGILSHVNLKRFLKQIRLTLEKMFTELKGDDLLKDVPKKTGNITRLEEMVEVL